jgi:hypothetical protein
VSKKPSIMAQHVAHLLVVWKLIGSNLGFTLSHSYYVRCENLIVRIKGMPWHKTGAQFRYQYKTLVTRMKIWVPV